jgi:4'-phosphopantetheinyl transferase
MPLGSAEIHLWLSFYDEITDGRLHSAYRELLNAEEREQEARFYFEKDRRRYLITRALVRTVLSRYISIPPEVRNACLSFNISHTHSLIVLGVTKGRALGVDVENLCAREASLDIADRYFAPQEVAVLTAAPRHQQQFRFFEYWTLKEAYIKARGMGLSLPLEKFSFDYPDDHAVKIAIAPELTDDPARWCFWQFRPTAEYLVAICAERIGDQSPRLIARQAVPMLGEKEVTLDFLRISE